MACLIFGTYLKLAYYLSYRLSPAYNAVGDLT